MEKPYLLHMITPEKNVSPFDANMAYDAGWDSIIPYTSVEMEEVQTLIQDAIFSRSPSTLKRTGIFFGGRDCHIAMDMIDAAKEYGIIRAKYYEAVFNFNRSWAKLQRATGQSVVK